MITHDHRLIEIAALITSGGVLCDVGSDHAYLPIYMRQNSLIRKAYALDISAVNVAKAEQNIIAAGITGVEPLLSDGLDAVEVTNAGINFKEISDIVIAGMGGENIAAILDKSDLVKCGVNLVLQPNSKTEFLRDFLFRKGYHVKEERLVRARKFLYVIINAVFKGEECKFSPSPADNLIGIYLNAQNSSLYGEYIQKTARRLESALKDLYDEKNNSYLDRLTEFGTVADIQLILSRIKNQL